MTEQEGRKFISYTERIEKIPITNKKIDRERDKLVASLDALKIPLGQALVRIRDDEDKINIELKDSVNDVCDWVGPVKNYVRMSQDIFILRQTEIEKIIDAIERIINITNDIELRNEAAEEIIKEEVIDDKELQAFREMIKARCQQVRSDLERQGGIVKSKLSIAKAIVMNEYNIKADETKLKYFEKIWGDEFAEERAVKRKKE